MVTILFLLTNSAFTFQNEPDGFRSLGWGDPPTEDMEFIGKHPEGERGYVVPDERLYRLGEVLLGGIVYVFRPNPERFMAVHMYFDGEENYEHLKTICRHKFGGTTWEKSHEIHWLGPTSQVTPGYKPKQRTGYLFFGSKMFLEDWLRSKEIEQVTRAPDETASVFWKSITEGLLVLGHWQVWVAAIVYMAINLGFLTAVGLLAGSSEYGSGGRMATGCLFRMIGGTVLHGLLMGGMVVYLLPILLGGTSTTPASLIIELWWPILTAGIIAVVAVTILAFIPVIGGLIANSPGIQAFLEGVIIFRLVSGQFIDEILFEANVQGNVYPGFWTSIGFLIIAAILVRGLMFGVALVAAPRQDTTVGEWITMVGGSVFGVVGGMIPLFMYSSYVRLSIMGLAGG